jgi:hypothetical protein
MSGLERTMLAVALVWLGFLAAVQVWIVTGGAK